MIERQLPEGVTLRELGKYRLKDLNEPEHLYQLVISELPADFPPLKALEIKPNNLPIQLTSFIGREQEIADIKGLLRSARLVTLNRCRGDWENAPGHRSRKTDRRTVLRWCLVD
jgi:hypothetical protein